ncbi:MAG: High-affnity carbon uptake protein Hat/HatR [Bacteroidales bacterium]|nr:MAG: High-affnity carbon uptake protein Hat/HatR [Bacteroidales bacterium]
MVTLTEQGAVKTKLINPFPGLRPFHTSEAHLFFGREGQSEEVLTNLSRNKFAAILGASGTGKSSLIYCGLLPILYGGFLHNGRSKWKVVITHPGSSPINNLAHSIAQTFGETNDESKIETDSLINRALIKRSSAGIANVINQYGINSKENVLILIDQFEELFRFQFTSKDADAANQVDHFVNLIVNTVRQSELPIYIVVTMRSDFIGECSPYQDLTRLINDSHYLIPRMNRDDFQKAITGPIAVGGGKITDQLVQLLLNEMGNNPDELPILQHSLMRTWDYWMHNSDGTNPLSIVEYEAIGRLERALSNHANEAFDELNFEQKHICEIIFKSLTEKGADNRGVRRPTSVLELARIAETNDQEIIKIVEIFRQKGRTFLTPPPSIALNAESMIDISHESLMRVWDKLKSWVEDESTAVKMYIRLAESAEQFHQGKTGLWGPPDLQLALNWRVKQNPNLNWAVRYNPAFERTMVYLKTSEEEYIAEEENKVRLQKRALRRAKIVAVVIGTAAMISIGLGLLALIQRQGALKSEAQALEAKDIAVAKTKEAEIAKMKADSSKNDAITQRNLADQERINANIQKQYAVISAEEAKKQRANAEAQTIIAKEKQFEATLNEQKAKEEQRKADIARQEADNRKMLSIAQSMAVKSEQMRTDTLLKGMLAFQAYNFNIHYKGVAYDPDIYKSIYASLKYFKGSNYNVYTGHTGIIRSFVQQNDQIITGGSDGRIIKWNTTDKNFTALAGNLQIVKKLVINGQTLYGLTKTEIVKYDLANGSSEIFNLINGEINYLFVLNSGKFLLVNNQNVVLTNDYKTQGVEVYKGDNKINSAKFDPKSGYLFIALANGKIFYWKNIQSGQETPIEIDNVSNADWGDLSYNPAKNTLVAGTNKQGTIYLWNLNTGEKQQLRGHTGRITGIEFSNDGSMLASSSYDKSVRVWQMDDLKTLPIVFDDHGSWATSVIFTKDDKYIISGDKDGNMRKFPTQVKTLIEGYCGFLSRELNQSEWNNYVGTDIPYKPTKCSNL